MNKLEFITARFPALAAEIPADQKPVFGKMNAHQMIEHMAYAFKQAAGLIIHEPLQDEATTQKMYAFMMSDKPFRDNTPNPHLPEEPPAPKTASIPEAINELRTSIGVFVDVFQQEPNKRIMNPFFGNLTFDEWTHLLYKHCMHHLKQFDIQPRIC